MEPGRTRPSLFLAMSDLSTEGHPKKDIEVPKTKKILLA